MVRAQKSGKWHYLDPCRCVFGQHIDLGASGGARLQCYRGVECGYEQNADLVGAINILAAGHAVIACGEMALSGRSVKQEPTKAAQAASA